jgi:hypothetical protein
MAITINNTPNDYEPIYTSSIPFEVTSTFQAEENFKYLFDLYVDGTFKNRVAPYPRPDSKGVYSPHLVLQSNTETELYHTITSIESNTDSKAFYYVRFGEQYNPGLTFADTDLATSFLGFTFSQVIVSRFFVGDIITVQKDNIAINPWIDGTASITALTSNFSIMTDKPRDPNVIFSAGETGTIINVSRLNATSSIYVGWNAARQEEEFFKNFESEYVMTSDQKFLSAYETAYDSDLTQRFPIYTDDWASLDLMVATGSFATWSTLWATYTYYDSSNSLLGTDEISISGDDTVLRWTIPTGTLNIFEIGGNGETFLNNGQIKYYNVFMSLGTASSPQLQISDTFNYEIIPDCRPYDVIRLAFLNKLGGFDYWNFNLVSKYTSNIDRTQINRAFLKNDSKVLKRGRDVIYSKAVENWTINSDFLTDEQALFIRELVESSDVYLLDEETERAWPIVITDNNWQYKSGLNDGYVQYTINFIKAYDIYINR